MRRSGLGRNRACVRAASGLVLALVAAGCASAAGPGVSSPDTRATAAVVPASALGNLTTYGYGNARSGHDVTDPKITTLSSKPIWDHALDAGVYGQPLVYGGTVYVATENDSIYALTTRTGKVIWHVHVGTAVRTSVIDSAPTLAGYCGDINPLGITGTPVINTANGQILAAEETEVGGNHWQNIQHWLVAVSLTTHHEVWHRQIDPPHANHANTYYIPAEQQRPALTLLGAGVGRVYVSFGGLNGDCGQYHGYVVDVPASGKGALVSYQVPTHTEGAIWGTGGPFVPSGGDLFVATGNGSSNSLAHFDEGNAVVELSPSLQRLGFWAPANWVQLNDEDWDLGSSGPIPVPDSSLLFVAGKPATNGSFGYLMKRKPLHGIGHGAYTGPVCLGGGAFGADATDVIGTGKNTHVYVYVPCGSGTEALEIHPASMSFQRAWSASTGSPNGSPIVAGGLVWALNFYTGELYGMNPTTGHVTITRSTDGVEHFAAPAVGDRLLFVPTRRGVEAFGT